MTRSAASQSRRAREISPRIMGYHDSNRDRDDEAERRPHSLQQRFRHIDWATVILVMLLGIVVVVPTVVALWRYLS